MCIDTVPLNKNCVKYIIVVKLFFAFQRVEITQLVVENNNPEKQRHVKRES